MIRIDDEICMVMKKWKWLGLMMRSRVTQRRVLVVIVMFKSVHMMKEGMESEQSVEDYCDCYCYV